MIVFSDKSEKGFNKSVSWESETLLRVVRLALGAGRQPLILKEGGRVETERERSCDSKARTRCVNISGSRIGWDPI